MIMFIAWLLHYSFMDSSTMIPTISWPLKVCIYVCWFVSRVCAQVSTHFINFASFLCFSLTRVCAHSMKFAYMFADILVSFATRLLFFELSLFFVFAYILVGFVQMFVGDVEGLISCLWISSNVWSPLCLLDCSDQNYNVGVWWQYSILARCLWDRANTFSLNITILTPPCQVVITFPWFHTLSTFFHLINLQLT
jgi:hypothetical protein